MASRPFHAPGCKNFIATAGLIISCAATSALATPSVNGNVVSWPDDGWYELQSADTYQTLCEGGTSLL